LVCMCHSMTRSSNGHLSRQFFNANLKLKFKFSEYAITRWGLYVDFLLIPKVGLFKLLSSFSHFNCYLHCMDLRAESVIHVLVPLNSRVCVSCHSAPAIFVTNLLLRGKLKSKCKSLRWTSFHSTMEVNVMTMYSCPNRPDDNLFLGSLMINTLGNGYNLSNNLWGIIN
jgi:hypothetical protein